MVLKYGMRVFGGARPGRDRLRGNQAPRNNMRLTCGGYHGEARRRRLRRQAYHAEAVMPSIFISYRREDSAYITGRIYESVAARFGKDHVFVDVASLRGGDDFRAVTGAGSHLDDCAGRDWSALA